MEEDLAVLDVDEVTGLDRGSWGAVLRCLTSEQKLGK